MIQFVRGIKSIKVSNHCVLNARLVRAPAYDGIHKSVPEMRCFLFLVARLPCNPHFSVCPSYTGKPRSSSSRQTNSLCSYESTYLLLVQAIVATSSGHSGLSLRGRRSRVSPQLHCRFFTDHAFVQILPSLVPIWCHSFVGSVSATLETSSTIRATTKNVLILHTA
jgi:hypothetical protein